MKKHVGKRRNNIDHSILMTLRMVKADFALRLTRKGLISHRISFVTLSNADIQFAEKELVSRSYKI